MNLLPRVLRILLSAPVRARPALFGEAEFLAALGYSYIASSVPIAQVGAWKVTNGDLGERLCRERRPSEPDIRRESRQ